MNKCTQAQVSQRADEKDYYTCCGGWLVISTPGMALKIIPITQNGQQSVNSTNKLCIQKEKLLG